jgi:hypothetical protein
MLMTSMVKITFSVSADGGILGGKLPIKAFTSPLTRHVLPQFELLVVACLSTHVISSTREPVG